MSGARSVIKGKVAEREIVSMLWGIYESAAKSLIVDVDPNINPFKRNQIQSAEGGSDVINPMGLCIEIKNHANVTVNKWWDQCLDAAKNFGGEPILIYKVARRGWYAVMMLPYPGLSSRIKVTLDEAEFRKVFAAMCIEYLTHLKT